jgi:hypothetical protein
MLKIFTVICMESQTEILYVLNILSDNGKTGKFYDNIVSMFTYV